MWLAVTSGTAAFLLCCGNQAFEWFGDSATKEITDEGSPIQIVDRENRPIIDSSSDRMRSYALELMEASILIGGCPQTGPMQRDGRWPTAACPKSDLRKLLAWVHRCP